MVPVEQTYIPDRIPAPQPAVTILYTAEGTPVQVVNVGSDDFILAGTYGFLSARSKSRCTVHVTMILSIIGAVFSIGCMSQGGIGTALAIDVYTYYGLSVRGYISITFHFMMAVLGLVERIVAIVAAAYCCHGCCQERSMVTVASGFPQAVQYQHNPTPYFMMSPPSDTVVAITFDNNGGAPAYARSNTPPPEYKEKMSL